MARSDRDLTPESIIQKVSDASGAKYSSSTAPPPSSGPPPIAAKSKPAFNPTRSGGTSGFNPLAGSRSRPNQDSNVDEDGWGADAPEVTRSQLEKVAPAYKPTKVNMTELTKQKQEPSRFNGREKEQDSDVVRGGYQPVGKVDIAAIRAKAQKKDDDRPTTVKGAYEPVGKVDIAAIRARAQKPADDGPRRISPAATGASATSNTGEEPKSLADRSSAFSQSERLTSMPKPKVANRFGSGASNFTGTKAPTPGAYGLQSSPITAAPAPVGAASRTFADEGGKTPAQIWQEKKARERGLSGAGNAAPSSTPPIKSQESGGGEWKSGYSGKSWAPVATTATGRSGSGSIGQQRTGEQEREDEEQAPASPAGGIGAIRDRFKGGAPMGAPSIPKATTGDSSASPPPINTSNRPTGGVPMPGLPSRPSHNDQDDEDEDDQGTTNMPAAPPRIQRSPTPPTPERETSPVRIAMPVSRTKAPEFEAPEERNSPPALPTNIGRQIPKEEDLTEEPRGHDPARGAGAAVAAATFGAAAAAATNQDSAPSGKRAVIQYDYEKAEDNELELVEGEIVTNIEMVDDDWWMGTNQKGESGLFPSNYVELIEGDEEEQEAPPAPAARTPAPAPEPAAESAGATAIAIYDYEAAEDNELSFDEDAKITGLEFPDEDWWFGHYNGKSGLFPANYVKLED
ncbi:putative protein app1 [Glarea lozoyensis 74030]|uniref:SH3 domain-containing protein n=1 Tax=Glarea lozoyensis (strain ATCC 74030 / MF5533) TaxID=1104152 RepID=H0EF26_GLAL7|nr:putative protein app1 [Glarea lozoyensis 74030]